MRGWLSLLLWLCVPCTAVAREASTFEKATTAYWRSAMECWGMKSNQPSQWEHQQIVKACSKWAGIRWPDHVEVMEERLYRLYRSEGPNPKDPSYGWLGVTLASARCVEKRYTPKGYTFPKTDKELSERLARDIDFNFMVGSGELFACMKGRSINYETWSVMRYKLGIRGARDFHKARRIRRRAWFLIRDNYTCIKKKVEAGDTSNLCNCMQGWKHGNGK